MVGVDMGPGQIKHPNAYLFLPFSYEKDGGKSFSI